MTVSGIEIEVVKKNIKSMRLYVLPPDGKVKISMPKNISEYSAEIFIVSKIDWIKKHIKRFGNTVKEKSLEYVSGENHYVFGEKYVMDIIHSDRYNKIEIYGDKLVFMVNRNKTLVQRKAMLNEWYRKLLKLKMYELFDKWEGIIGVHANETYVKNMNTRWGSCNVEKKRIWINLQLAKKSIRCLEYIIVHELTHFLERRHNRRFKEYMTTFMPDWKERNKELNQLVF